MIAAIFHRFGPYHLARLSAAGRRGPVVGIEVSATTRDYAWDAAGGGEQFRRVTLVADDAAVPRGEVVSRLSAALAESRPEAVFVNGWAEALAAEAVRWCLRNKVPAVVMSESTAIDEPRKAWKEAVKRQVVKCFSAALVGGTRSRDYAAELGVPADRIFLGYDAVDNAHFAAGADAARGDPSARQRYGVPDRYFLASNRFIPKKNLPLLLRAFAGYRKAAGPSAWDLVLLGDGPTRPEVEAAVRDLGLTGAVRVPGFKQYGDLPAYYGLAGAFVHASTSEQWGLVVNEAMAAGLPVLVSDRCGCAPDLVQNGANGHRFDPADADRLAALMGEVAGDDAARERFGRASREIVAEWSTERFGEMFWKAAAAARTSPPRAGLASRLALRALASK